MAEVESGSRSGSLFLKWLGGILTAVLVPVLIFYLTRPAPPPPQPIAQSEFDGFIQDANSHNLIPGARLTLTLGPNSIVQTTDGSGKYSVVLPSPNADASMGMIAITATGYEPFTNSVELKPGVNYSVIPIDAYPPHATPVPANGAAPGAGAVVAATPPPPPPPTKVVPSNLTVMRQLPPNFIKAQTAFLRR